MIKDYLDSVINTPKLSEGLREYKKRAQESSGGIRNCKKDSGEMGIYKG